MKKEKPITLILVMTLVVALMGNLGYTEASASIFNPGDNKGTTYSNILTATVNYLTSLSDEEFIQVFKTISDFRSSTDPETILMYNDNVLVFTRKDLAEFDNSILSDSYYFDILARRVLDIVDHRLSGKYFTYSGKPCLSHFASGHGCWNCSATHIIDGTCEWYKKLFPEVAQYTSARHFPYIATSNTGKSYTGQSCFAFGCWCSWYVNTILLGESNLTGRPHYLKGKFTYDFFSKNNVRADDVIRRKGTHTMVVYSIDKDGKGIWVMDSNMGSYGGQLNCKYNKHYISFVNANKNYSIVISRPVTMVND